MHCARFARKTMIAVCLSALAFTIGIAQAADKPAYPSTAKRPVTDEYWGVKISEDYRWLEKADDTEVQAWTAEQNKLTLGLIDASANHAGINVELKRLYEEQSSAFFSLVGRPGVLFAMKDQPPKQQSFLVTLGSVMDTTSARAIVDPNVIDTSGHTAIDWYVPSTDGKLVAVCMSSMGSELGTVYIYDVASATRLADTVPRVNGPTAGGGLAWNADGSGFHYTRYPHKGERPDADLAFYQQVYFH
ncbi:MAG: S9 family peptidase, partial [candidate division Zixibacteria bacterium]|nr:S9 family peptidase [candidate division Zixibacteria bacterium]